MFIEVGSIKTHYQQIGQGKALVMLHGWGGNWETWYPVISQLSAHYTLLIPDLPAFGQSQSATDTWSTVEYVEWLSHFVAATTNNQDITVMGHSFGGKIAAVWAAQHPAHLRRLVLVSTSGIPDKLPAQLQLQKNILGVVPTALKNLIPARFKRKLLEKTGSSTDHFYSTQEQKAILKRIVSEDISATLPHIAAPTLLIWGKHDPETPLHQGQKFHKLIPDSQLEIFEHSGHFPFIDETQRFIDLLQ